MLSSFFTLLVLPCCPYYKSLLSAERALVFSRERERERENQFKKHMCIEIAAVLGIPQSRSASCCSLEPQTKEADFSVTLPFFLPLRPARLAPSFACNSQFPRNIDEMIGYICRVRDVAPSECSTPPRPRPCFPLSSSFLWPAISYSYDTVMLPLLQHQHSAL